MTEFTAETCNYHYSSLMKKKPICQIKITSDIKNKRFQTSRSSSVQKLFHKLLNEKMNMYLDLSDSNLNISRKYLRKVNRKFFRLYNIKVVCNSYFELLSIFGFFDFGHVFIFLGFSLSYVSLMWRLCKFRFVLHKKFLPYLSFPGQKFDLNYYFSVICCPHINCVCLVLVFR